MKHLKQIAQYSNTRISHEQLDETNYVEVSNLLPNYAGKENSIHVPTSGNHTEYREGDILIGNIGPHQKKIWYADCVGGASSGVLVIRTMDKNINSRYLYYVLADDKFFEYNTHHVKGLMPRGNKSKIMEYKIPIPCPDDPSRSLEIQTEIVRTLNAFSSLTLKLTAELDTERTAREKQYNYYRNKLLSIGEGQ